MGITPTADWLAKNSNESKDYLARIARSSIKNGMIHWHRDEAYRWAGPWSGGYCFFTITDGKKRSMQPLKSIDEALAARQTWVENSVFFFPQRLTASLNLNIQFEGQPCRRTAVTEEEKFCLLQAMSNEELQNRADRIESEKITAWRERFIDPSIECPVKVYLCGNDDFSMTLCVETAKRAAHIIKEIAESPRFSTLKRLGFEFSN